MPVDLSLVIAEVECWGSDYVREAIPKLTLALAGLGYFDYYERIVDETGAPPKPLVDKMMVDKLLGGRKKLRQEVQKEIDAAFNDLSDRVRE